MRSAFRVGASSFVVDLCGGQVAMTEQLLDLGDVNAGIEQQRCCRRAQRVRREDTFFSFCPVRVLDIVRRTRHPAEIALDGAVHGDIVHGFDAKLFRSRLFARTKKRAARDAGMSEIFGDRLSGREVDADRTSLVAFLVEAQRGLVAVLMEVAHLEATAGAESNARVQIGLEDGAIAIVDHGITCRHGHQLARPCGRQRPRFLAGIARGARNELRMRRVRHNDGQPKFSGRAAQEFEKARERGNPPVDGFRGRVLIQQMSSEVEHLNDRHAEHGCGVLRPVPAHELHEGHHVVTVGAPRVRALAPVDPELKDAGDVRVEVLNLLLDSWRCPAVWRIGGSARLVPPETMETTCPAFSGKLMMHDNRFYLA